MRDLAFELEKTPEVWARGLAKGLLGDEDAMLPASGSYVYEYFAGMNLERAMKEFYRVRELNEGRRLRDLMRQMGEDRL